MSVKEVTAEAAAHDVGSEPRMLKDNACKRGCCAASVEPALDGRTLISVAIGCEDRVYHDFRRDWANKVLGHLV